jgi:hypothetical protein
MASSTSTPQLSTATSSPPATGLVSPADDELAGKTPATAAEVNEDVDEDEPEAKTFDPDFVAQETTEVRPSRLAIPMPPSKGTFCPARVGARSFRSRAPADALRRWSPPCHCVQDRHADSGFGSFADRPPKSRA